MNSTFFKLMSLTVMTLSMMIAFYGNAGAQTAPRTGRNLSCRIQTKAVTVVDVTGEAIQRSDAGNQWQTLDTETMKNVVSDLQQKVARHRVAGQTPVIGENLTGETMNDAIAISDRVQLNGDNGGIVNTSTKNEKAQ